MLLFCCPCASNLNQGCENCCQAVTALFNILQAVLKHLSPSQILLKIPHDPCTLILKAVLRPTLVTTPCFWTCFSLYPLTPSTNDLHLPIFQRFTTLQRRTVDLHTKQFGILQCQFFTQPITAWLGWLLAKPEIELLAIDNWAKEVRNSPNKFGDVQQVLMFRKLSSDISPSFLELVSFAICGLIQPLRNQDQWQEQINGYTINHLLKPIVDKLMSLDLGVIMKAHQHPQGWWLEGLLHQLRLATWFLAQCQCLQNLKLGVTCKREETITEAKNSKLTASANLKIPSLKILGCKIALGIMHNFLEGDLQSHWRYQWRFIATSLTTTQKLSQPVQQLGNKRQWNLTDTPMMMEIEYSSEESSDNDKYKEYDILLSMGKNGGFFTQEDSTKFCQNMTGVVLPPGLPKLPEKLREESHEKLKEAQWYCLFAYVIPLVVFDLYLSNVQDRCNVHTFYLISK
ncbi:hypothetical protein VP01_2297g2 [Puccinia sorghi]|uniref:Uncharacterized protein n=1 Tax=Puccinia sorghi TaxID=27349 RepID=A0A0L6V803_9BASI|nr:hypothetical protein VP01_2297g2 [Puccinia sorghi]